MHTHKHLPPPLQTARMSKCVLLCSRQRPKPSKLRCGDKHVCCVRVCLIVSGRCLLCRLCIMIKLCSAMGGLNSRRDDLGQLQPHHNEAPAEAQLRSEQTGTQEVFLCVKQWLNLAPVKPVQLQVTSSPITYNLWFYAEVRMSAALMGPEVNTPVRICRGLMWKLITESCSLKTDKWVMEAICYIKTGMREVVLVQVCVSIRKTQANF